MTTDTITGQAETTDIKTYGFWIYLMSDLIIFGCLFATYGVLHNNTAGGPSGKEIFELKFVLGETFLLLFSSFTYGLAVLAMNQNRLRLLMGWLLVTFLLGAGFVGMELYEFHHLINEGAGPDRSGFLSGFFCSGGHPRSARELWPAMDAGYVCPVANQRADRQNAPSHSLPQPVLALSGYRVDLCLYVCLSYGGIVNGYVSHPQPAKPRQCEVLYNRPAALSDFNSYSIWSGYGGNLQQNVCSDHHCCYGRHTDNAATDLVYAPEPENPGRA
jgi:cytochrome o ubiquinol oxidase subunit 3